jgi:hypothetical protein
MGKLKDSYWPDITTTAIAEKCIKNAAGVAYFVAGLTALLAALAWFDVIHIVSPWSVIDAVLFAVIGFFISRGSRVAASLGLALYLFESVDRLLSGGGSSGGASVAVVFFMLFWINGVRGAFALVRLRQQPDNLAPITGNVGTARVFPRENLHSPSTK